MYSYFGKGSIERTLNLWAKTKLSCRRKLTKQIKYRDHDGKKLHTKHLRRIKVPSHPPSKMYWSFPRLRFWFAGIEPLAAVFFLFVRLLISFLENNSNPNPNPMHLFASIDPNHQPTFFPLFLSQRELEKQRQLEHNRHQIAMATQHYATTLLVKFGLLPWRRLVEMSHEKMSRATLHHNRVSLTCCFYPLLDYMRKMKEDRERAAESLYNKILLRRTWKQWRKVSPTWFDAYLNIYTIPYFTWKYDVRSDSVNCQST